MMMSIVYDQRSRFMRSVNSMGDDYSVCKACRIMPSVRTPECIIIVIYNRSPWTPPIRPVAPSPWGYPYIVIGPVNISYQRPRPYIHNHPRCIITCVCSYLSCWFNNCFNPINISVTCNLEDRPPICQFFQSNDGYVLTFKIRYSGL